jgi:ABC-type sugar transport system ATPase subunit
MSFARVVAADGRLRGPGVDVAAPPGVSGELMLGVRPEHARRWADDAGLLGPLEGTVAYVEALGRETFVGVDAADDVRFVVDVEGRAGVQPGDSMRFGLVPEGLKLFDASSGAALAPAERVRT